MFSFHKPKIYRSNNGCCICKAKSSSSRFTDSKKYETEFERCFLIKECRTGEICNACVLLVKRCKKLPKEANKHWAHVVDARAGPGTKSIKLAKSLSQSTNNSNNKVKNNSSYSSNSNAKLNRNKLSSNTNNSERKICEKILLKRQQNLLVANENESGNIVSNSEILKQSADENCGQIDLNCECSNCLYNKQLNDLDSKKIKTRSSNGLTRHKKTLTPKKICTETISNSSSEDLSDSNEDEEDFLSDYAKKKCKVKNQTKVLNQNNLNSEDNLNCNESLKSINNRKSKINKTKNSRTVRKFSVKQLQRNESTFLDMNFWQREQVCCGIIFRNRMNNMVLIDSKLFTPCSCRKKSLEEKNQKLNEENSTINQQMKLNLNTELKDKHETTNVQETNSFDKNNNFVLEEENISTIVSQVQQKQTNEKKVFEDEISTNLNSSSGISSDSSDISSINGEEDSNSSLNVSNNLSSKASLINSKKNKTATFGVL